MQTLKTMMNSVRVLLGLGAMLLVVTPTWATLYVLDPVPADSTGSGGRYKSSVKLYGQTTTNAAIIGETGAWGAYDAGTVFMPETLALSYPGNVILTATGGSFSIRTNGVSQVDGHLQSRPITGLPTSGTVYLSLLTRIDSSGINYLTNGMSMGMGLSTNSASTKLTFGALPPNGVYLGFCSNTIAGPGRALMLNVLGQNYCLVSNPAVNTTFFCLAKIDIGAGEGGADVVSAVVNPSAMPATQAGYTVTVTNWVLNGGSFTHLSLGGAIRTNDKRIQFDEIRVASTLSEVAPIYFDRPEFGIAPTVTCGADNIFRFSSTLTNVTADTQLFACYGTTSGSTSPSSWEYSKLVSAPPTVNVASTTTLDAFVTNTCYTFAALATNANFSVLKTGTTFMTGEVWLTPGSNALESSSVPGSVIVHRPASATQADLVVNYTVSGSATPDVNYFTNNLVGSVTIPAGQETASIAVLPMVSPSSSSPSVSITLAEGRYYIGAANSASITIENYDYPADRNIWVATSASRASDYRNWSQGRIPNATDSIQLDSSSTNSLSWDAGVNGLTDTVASWTQTTNYTGTVTFNTTYSTAATVFTNFTISGNAEILGGKWTHQSNASIQSNRLCVAVGGDFTLGTGTSIALLGKGFQYGQYHTGSAIATHAASPYGYHSQIYGNVYEPTELGSGGDSASSAKSYGGGAVYLVVGGSAIVDGMIDVRSSSQKTGNNPERGCGAGGSVYLSAASISGVGSVNASCYDVAETSYSYNGSGGRVALIAKTGTVSLPVANLKANGGAAGNSAGGGTIFIKNATDANGTLLVGNDKGNDWSYVVRPPKKTSCTAVRPGETWTFDRIFLRDQGIVSVPATATLALSGGWQSVTNLTSTTDPMAGILYLGGTINVPATAEHQISGKWIFQSDSPYTFNGDVRISNYAAFGNLILTQENITNAPACIVAVNGNLAVTSTGYLYGPGRGIRTGGGTISYHGGVYSGATNTLAYDSILNPGYPGSNGRSGDAGNTNPGGGTLKVTVSGTFTHDGVGTVDPVTKNAGFNRGAGGTLNITAAYLAGSGTLSANGTAGSGEYYSGAGGRISVRLTGAGATFDAFGAADINAKGGTHSSGTASLMASAGTVYLQDGTQAERAGTVIVRNTGHATNTALTPIPATRWGGENDVLEAASLSIEASARIKLSASLKMQQVAMSTGTVLDLASKTFIVRGMTAGGARVSPGVYVAGSTLFTDGYVTDSVGGGVLQVLGDATVIMIY